MQQFQKLNIPRWTTHHRPRQERAIVNPIVNLNLNPDLTIVRVKKEVEKGGNYA